MFIDAKPWTDQDPAQWEGSLGPVWIERQVEPGSFGRRRFHADRKRIAPGLRAFMEAVGRVAPGHLRYGTLYAVRLDGSAVAPGDLHYDLGEYSPGRGALRYVSTWASDGRPLQNTFLRPEFNRPDLMGLLTNAVDLRLFVQPPNNHLVAMHEGTDLHARLAVEARPGGWGVFISAALYRHDEPANLHCPRLAELRNRGMRSYQEARHRRVARTTY